jgi:hypothetical protein
MRFATIRVIRGKEQDFAYTPLQELSPVLNERFILWNITFGKKTFSKLLP